jgi:dTDP-4-amino-4,6-dideoxygalactose transaminase
MEKTMSSIPLVNLHRAHQALRDPLNEAISSVIDRGDFILGAHVEAFEAEFAQYCGVKHCIGVGNGGDALVLALRGVGVGRGDEVITAANTFAATVMAILEVGAVPVLVDHASTTYNLDPRKLSAAITPRTKAIVPVHLYGRPADMDAIQVIADEHGLLVVEDACQAHGGRYKGRRCGSLSRAAAFSFYPGKNLGALGDAGAVVTDDDDLADWIRQARSYGSAVKYVHQIRGMNTRLDTVQAAVLRVKLRHLDRWNELRRQRAAQYCELLSSADVILPEASTESEHVFHLFVARSTRRDELLAHLQRRGIGAGLHYPHPISKQVALERSCIASGSLTNSDTFCDEVISLPICPFITEEEVQEVASAVTEFAGKQHGAHVASS